MYRTAQYMKQNRAKNVFEALDVVLRIYNSAGFRIAEIHCDREFEPIFTDLKDEWEELEPEVQAEEPVVVRAVEPEVALVVQDSVVGHRNRRCTQGVAGRHTKDVKHSTKKADSRTEKPKKCDS